MVRKLNLEAMSVGEIWQLHQTVIEVLAARLTAEKHELEKRLSQLRRERHESIPQPARSDLRRITGITPETRKYAKVPPKYRNPKDPSETWTGRGKRPRWLAQALLAGDKIEDFVIGVSEPQPRTLTEA
jgi:DNA-binding protein H-NS